MRSWDLWLGLPYDTFMFGTLALAMAGAIHAKPGFVRVQATSAHLYEKHLEKAREAAMDGRLENRLGAYDLSSRGWARLGDENDNTRYWGGVKHVADVSLEYCPWAGPAVDWEKVQKSGLVRFV